MGFVDQFFALLEKDVWIRKIKRHWIATSFEFVIPIVVIVAMRVTMNSYRGPNDYRRGGWRPSQRFKPLGPFEKPQGVDSFQHVYYVPSTNYSRTMVLRALQVPEDELTGLSTHEEFQAKAQYFRDKEGFAIYFPEKPSARSLQYTLRFPASAYVEPLQDIRRILSVMISIFREHVGYYKRGVQDFHVPVLQPFPTGLTYIQPTLGMRQMMASMFVGHVGTLGFMWFFISFCKFIMKEKENRFKELLRMMGMSDKVYWLNLVCVALSTGLPLCVLCAVMLTHSSMQPQFFKHSSTTIVFTTFLFFVIGNILIVLLVTVICYTERAVITAVTIYLFGVQYWFHRMFPATGDSSTIASSQKILSSIIPGHGFAWCMKLIYEQEAELTGSHWKNLWTQPPGDNISLGTLYLVQIFSWVFWFCLVLYVDLVNPWQHGIPKKPLFCLEYLPCWSKPAIVEVTSTSDHGDSDMIEKISTDAKPPVVRVVRVSHSFGEVKAIDNLSLELYGDQITVLLGHNGAGKTTIMNIITGLYAPHKGDIFINNHSVTKATKKARESLGLCPQHNVLFEYLTVGEHLRFFAKLKGSKKELIAEEIDKVLGKIDLLAKKDTLSVNLSGGMKRKLSLANAVIGGSKILILDEPSSGLDPEARRHVWAFLQEERRKRTILMTTHHMEEADVLGDRIILLARGRLMSAGSPMFLKKVFQTGYKIRVAKESPEVGTGSILSAVKNVLGDSSQTKIFLASELAFEVVINIGFPTIEKMVELFKMLESEKKNLGITNIGASVTTMEDVFIKVGDVDEAALKAAAEVAGEPQAAVNQDNLEKLPHFKPLTGCARLSRQFWALIWKRFHAFRREWASFLHLLIWPIIFILLFAASLESLANEGKISKYSLKSLIGTTRGFIAGKLNNMGSRARERFVADGVRFDTHLEDSDDVINNYLLRLHNASAIEYRTKWSVGLSNKKLWFNLEPAHLPGAALARWQSFALTQIMEKDAEVDVSHWPFSVTQIGRLEIEILLARMTASLLLPTVFSYMACPTISYAVTERETKSKLIQLMTGVSPTLFHAANFFFDFVYQTIFAAILLGLLLSENPGGCFSYVPETFRALIALFLSYNLAMISWSYFMSIFFSDAMSALTGFTNMNAIPAAIAAVVLALGEAFHKLFSSGLLENFPFLIQIASIHPTFSAVWGTTSVIINGLSQKLCKFRDQSFHQMTCTLTHLPSCCQPCKNDSSLVCYEYQTSFSMDPILGVGYQISILQSIGLLFTILVILNECNFESVNAMIERVKKLTRKEVIDVQTTKNTTGPPINNATRDADVIEEQQVVENIVKEQKTTLHTLVAHKLSKYFGNFKAVSEVSFHLTGNECFGLLGTNGAGKTTTFGMLVGDVPLSEGNAFIKGFSINTSLYEYRQQIGYCPQFDALQSTLTGRETLELFCALRAIPKHESRATVTSLSRLVDIVPHLDKRTEEYSGGNKRKLSLAVALVGNPAILLLDEPTAGVDPTARRKIYSTLARSQKDFNTAIVLTSHSIEVCEALCQRVAIMVAGSFRCLGPTQHLKSKYGTGYTVQIKLKKVHENTGTDLSRTMSQMFEGKCTLKQSYMSLFQYHVNDVSLKWSELFERVQKLRENATFAIEDIQVSDTTLEELFLAFGKMQKDEPLPLPSST